MKNLKILIVPLLSLLWMSTSSNLDIQNTFALGKLFKVKLGEVAHLENENLTISITEILEDSRCPVGTNCVWEGQVRAAIKVEIEGRVFNKEIIYRSGRDMPLKVEDYSIRFFGLSESKQIDEDLKIKSLVFNLIVEKS